LINRLNPEGVMNSAPAARVKLRCCLKETGNRRRVRHFF